MKLNQIYTSTSKYLKPDDLEDKKPVLTISAANIEEKDYGDGQGMKKQIVLSFYKTDKVLGLNYTNAAKIAELLGSDDSDEWVGKSIKLYKDKVKVGSEMKPCIRIFPELPEQKAVEPDLAPAEFSGTEDDKDLPF